MAAAMGAGNRAGTPSAAGAPQGAMAAPSPNRQQYGYQGQVKNAPQQNFHYQGGGQAAARPNPGNYQGKNYAELKKQRERDVAAEEREKKQRAEIERLKNEAEMRERRAREAERELAEQR